MLLQVDVVVEVEYVPEKADVDGSLLEDFRSVFEKFSFKDTASISEEEAKKEEASDAAKKRVDSDSDEEEQDVQQRKEGAISNKKRKVRKIFLFLLLKLQVVVAPGLFLMSKVSFFFFCSYI
jgi:splicing factor 3B subunit 2